MTAKKAILAVSALALVAACTQTDGQLDRRRTGALAGGVIGGLVGAANGGNNSTPEVLIGAGLGALAGKIWRIGLMGHSAQPQKVDRVLAALADVLH